MDGFFKFLKKYLSRRRVKVIMYSILIGVVVVPMFSGKSDRRLETIAVSSNEKYVAYSVSGLDYKTVSCYHADGLLAFESKLPTNSIVTGSSALWFDGETLCVLFYRSDKVVHFAMDGTILDTTDYTAEKSPSAFPLFTRNGRKYTFEGSEIQVVYNERGFWGYWLFGAERYLEITPKSGDPVYIWKAVAENSKYQID